VATTCQQLGPANKANTAIDVGQHWHLRLILPYTAHHQLCAVTCGCSFQGRRVPCHTVWLGQGAPTSSGAAAGSTICSTAASAPLPPTSPKLSVSSRPGGAGKVMCTRGPTGTSSASSWLWSSWCRWRACCLLGSAMARCGQVRGQPHHKPWGQLRGAVNQHWLPGPQAAMHASAGLCAGNLAAQSMSVAWWLTFCRCHCAGNYYGV
jgi:hypothetical protein